MTQAYVLMTAMPPTKGHFNLIEFASHLADSVVVIVCTQPSEPMADQRLLAIEHAVRRRMPLKDVRVRNIHRELPQEPEGEEGFWDMWVDFLNMFGFEPDDYIVASEPYGKQLADHAGGRFMPYDIERAILDVKATRVRTDTRMNFSGVLPEFQQYLRKTITIFGAESTGKTTLSRKLAWSAPGHLLFEWARPYLENVKNVINTQSMTEIWLGQRALQDHGQTLLDKPFVIQDTDLFSTLGYWQMAPWENLGAVPEGLIDDACDRMSDLYIILRSNIPFESDPLRYGGDHREITDQQWIKFADQWSLPYVILEESDLREREAKAWHIVKQKFDEWSNVIDYHRRGKEYENAPVSA